MYVGQGPCKSNVLKLTNIPGWRRISPAKEENAASHFILIPEKLRAAWAFRLPDLIVIFSFVIIVNGNVCSTNLP